MQRAEKCELPVQKSILSGMELLRNPRWNKGMAFTMEERKVFRLQGLLPPVVLDQDTQVKRALEAMAKKPNMLEKFIYMVGLQDRNEHLFYRLLLDYTYDMMPIVYTPVVGQACQEYGHIFRRPRGLYISANDKGHFIDLLRNWPEDNIKVIVITDGERILGLGDQGNYGMGIPVGKLSLYVALAGIPPQMTLPVMLDTGTNNQNLINDPMYTGLKMPRIRGAAFDELVAEFVEAVKTYYGPQTLIQWEDFGNLNAFRVLENWRHKCTSFNDDIQGTASISVAGIFGAMKLVKKRLSEMKFLMVGAGEAGIGIADLISYGMFVEDGVPLLEARKNIYMTDSKGLVVASRTGLTEHKQKYAHEGPEMKDLLEIVRWFKPNGIIGVSATPRIFTKELITELSSYNEHPIIFALSNPTSKAECTAEEAYTWSNGTAIFASGSPFPDVQFNGRLYIPGQGNNAYIFPGVGMGIILSGATKVTDEMFYRAAKALASLVTDEDLSHHNVYPPLTKIRECSAHCAAATILEAYNNGFGTVFPRPPETYDELVEFVKTKMYDPHYVNYLSL